MAALSTQTINRAGITPTYSAVSSSDTFTPGANTFLFFKNAGASPDNVTVPVLAGDPSGLTIADLTSTVTNGTERMIGPFNPQFFADPTTGLATINSSFVTSVTIAVLNLSQP